MFPEHPAALWKLAGLPGDRDGYRLTAAEVKQTAFWLDGVLLPPPGAPPDAPVLFLETQLQPDAAFFARWLASILLYLYREKIDRPWLAVAVLADRAMAFPLTPAYAPQRAAGLVRLVYLEDLPRLARSDPGIGLRLLRLLIREPAVMTAEARDLAALARSQPEPLPLLDLLETMLVYRFPDLSRQEIATMLQLPDTDLKQTCCYPEIFADGKAQGREKGIGQGIDIGRAETRRETAANLRRLTALDDAAIAATGLSLAAVERLRATGG